MNKLSRFHILCLALLIIVSACDRCNSASAPSASTESSPPSSEIEENEVDAVAEAEAAQETAEPEATQQTPEVAQQLRAAVEHPSRSAEHKARDAFRHPFKTLSFFGIKPTMTVIEMRPGKGWYAEILAAYLKGQGKYIAATVDPQGEKSKYAKMLFARMEQDKSLFANASTVTFEPPDHLSLGPILSADAVLTFRNMHGWANHDQTEEFLKSVFAVLKPEGILGIVQHRAKVGSDFKESAKQGYISQQALIDRVEKAGFKLEASSEINANPKDTKDHPEGVWTLPPTLKLGEQDKQKYIAIGESDRMTLRFRKPSAS